MAMPNSARSISARFSMTAKNSKEYSDAGKALGNVPLMPERFYWQNGYSRASFVLSLLVKLREIREIAKICKMMDFKNFRMPDGKCQTHIKDMFFLFSDSPI